MTSDQDTSIYSDGFSQYESYGTESTLLVQNGPAEFYEIADAFVLISFNTAGLMPSPKKATLQLTHLPSTKFRQQDSTITIFRRNSMKGRIETFHGGYTSDQVEGQVTGPSFTVAYDDNKTFRIDVTSLINKGEGFPTQQMLFLLDNRGPEQSEGDRFYSRESKLPPQLELTF